MAVPPSAESLAALQRQQSASALPVRHGTSIPVPTGPGVAPAGSHPVGQPTFFAGPSLGQLDAANTNVIKSPPSLKLLSFVECQNHPKPYVLPPPNPANPIRCAVRALLAGQAGAVLAGAGLQPYTGQGTVDHTAVGSVARARCLLAALAGLKRNADFLSESTAALSSYFASLQAATATGSGAGVAALATFLLLHAEALRSAGFWRECVFVAHGVLRLLVAAAEGVGAGTATSVGTTCAPGEGVGGAAATWASAQPFSDAPTAPLAERCLAYLQQHCASIPSSHVPRLVHASSSCASAALQEAGYMVVSGTALVEGCTLLTALARAAEATGTVSYDLSSPSTGRGPCSFPQSLAEGPAWLYAGLLQLSLSAVQRNNGREADANAAAAAVDTLPGWSRGAALLSSVLSAAGPGPMAVQAVQVENAPSGDRYTAACLAVTKAAAAMGAGKPQEALLLAECGIVAAASVVKHTLLPFVTGSDGPVTTSHGQAGEEDAALLGNSADTAAACVGGWATDPADVLIACLLIASESTRRLGTTATGTAPGAYAVAMGMMEGAVRAAPALVLRPEFIAALCALYDSAKDHVSAAGSKRLLYNTAQRFGLGLDAATFKLA